MARSSYIPIRLVPPIPGKHFLWDICSRNMMRTVVAGCKVFLNVACRDVRIYGAEAFWDRIHHIQRPCITGMNDVLRLWIDAWIVANHVSTMDDPMIWGTMPMKYLFSRHCRFRWSLGAREICHSNPFFEWFFTLGQTLPIVRGEGIYQPVMDLSLELLKHQQWIHLFPEGMVNQGEELGRLKWGLARLALESPEPPILFPIFIRGFEKMLPLEHLIPRLGKDVAIAFGEPFEIDERLREEYQGGKRAKHAARIEVMKVVHEKMQILKQETLKR